MDAIERPGETARALFRRSPLKRQKFRVLADLIGETRGRRCLDIGADNGVISYLLRERGGSWASADLDERTVGAIRALVGGDVHRIDGRGTPFDAASFDVVAIVDFLEHVHTDRKFAAEMARILRPGGILVVNVPHLKPRSLINRARRAIGLTDEEHGHVRPGYDLAGLRRVLGPWFDIERSVTYSRAGSETVDLLLNGAHALFDRRGRSAQRSAKGVVVGIADWRRRRGRLLALSVVQPLLWLVAQVDRLLFLQPGYKLAVRAVRRDAPAPAAEPERETPDIESSTDAYARRFAGPVGAWFLERQARLTLDLLSPLPRGARILDVGGGHAQLVPALLEAGYRVAVLGSDRACRARLERHLRPGRCEFLAGDLLDAPCPDGSFDAVLAFRMLAHTRAWDRLIRELCRVARTAVIVDFPSRRSLNALSAPLFALKRGVEKDTRPFRSFAPRRIRAAFETSGWRVDAARPQFLLPMALHRLLPRAAAARLLEEPGRITGLTDLFGSPVIARAVRSAARAGTAPCEASQGA